MIHDQHRSNQFQHTATRRWLLATIPYAKHIRLVSTHSHPKVAAQTLHVSLVQSNGFNTQPPEGGCNNTGFDISYLHGFQHTATRRWLLSHLRHGDFAQAFQHTATRRWLRFIHLLTIYIPLFQHTATRRWLLEGAKYAKQNLVSFNTQPPEGGCTQTYDRTIFNRDVSTHSHPKVAAPYIKK